MLTRLATRAAAACAAAVLLTACTLGDGASDDGSGSGDGGTEATTAGGATSGGGATPDGIPEPYLPVPNGIVLTDPGSELGLGEKATVAWRPRQGEVGVLDVKVRKLVRGDMSDLKEWQLKPAERASSLYYVTVTVANVGDTDLGGVRIPLYAYDPRGALVESSAFKTEFDPCPSPALPTGFVTGEKATMCQAYLVPRRGELAAVSFKPTRNFNPITWVGKVVEPKKPKKPNAAG